MPKVVVSDTSCLIALSNIDELDLLEKLYRSIITTPTVANEFGQQLPDWVTILAPADIQKQQLLELLVDAGEASAIVLALELKADLIILDDQKARVSAEKLGLNITGTIGVIVRAKKTGVIPSIRPIVDKLTRTDFRISDELLKAALKLADE